MVTHLQMRATCAALTMALALPAFAQTGTQETETPSIGGGLSESLGLGGSKATPEAGQQGAAQSVDNIEALSNATGTVQIEGRVSEVETDKNQFTIADDTGDIDVMLQGTANIREGDRVQVIGTVEEHTFGNNLQAERVELLNPRGEEREKMLYNQQPQQQQPQQ